MSPSKPPRLAARAIILKDNRLLLVNAWPGKQSDLWCAPGGGVEAGSSLPDNLAREVMEETGLTIRVDTPCLVNEFYDPKGTFHQVEIFFRCHIEQGTISDDWRDPEGVVNRRLWVTQEQLAGMKVKPSSLANVAWSNGFGYDVLEPILR